MHIKILIFLNEHLMYHHLTVVCELKLISAALIHFLQTFERLNKSGITQLEGKLPQHYGWSWFKSVLNNKAKVDSGQELRVVFDNFDFRILTNIILRNHRNSHMHWIAQYVTFDRVPPSHLDDSKPIVPDIKDFDNVNYLMSKTEFDQQRDNYVILVARVLMEFFPALEPLRDAHR